MKVPSFKVLRAASASSARSPSFTFPREPPLPLVAASLEYSLANAAKSSPFLSLLITSFALAYASFSALVFSASVASDLTSIVINI